MAANGYKPTSPTGSGVRRSSSARELATLYSGAGKTFKVKFLGSEEVSSSSGDAVAADCLKNLRSSNIRSRTVKPRATLTLQLKSFAVFDEKSKSPVLRVPIDKVTFVCHDPADTTVFAVIVRSEETVTLTGLKLYAFQSDQKTAASFVSSARELFRLMFRLIKAKQKKESVELESSPFKVQSPLPVGTSTPKESVQSSTEQTQVQQSPSLPPSFPSSASSPCLVVNSPSERGPQQTAKDRQQAVQEEWQALELELKKIAEDLAIVESANASLSASNSPTKTKTTSVDFTDTAGVPYSASPAAPVAPQMTSTPASSMSDPFADEFFARSFDTPSKFDANSSSWNTFGTELSPRGTPPLRHRGSHPGNAPSSNPFLSAHGTIDPFQSPAHSYQVSSGCSALSTPATAPIPFDPFDDFTSSSVEFSNSLYTSAGSGASVTPSSYSTGYGYSNHARQFVQPNWNVSPAHAQLLATGNSPPVFFASPATTTVPSSAISTLSSQISTPISGGHNSVSPAPTQTLSSQSDSSGHFMLSTLETSAKNGVTSTSDSGPSLAWEQFDEIENTVESSTPDSHDRGTDPGQLPPASVPDFEDSFTSIATRQKPTTPPSKQSSGLPKQSSSSRKVTQTTDNGGIASESRSSTHTNATEDLAFETNFVDGDTDLTAPRLPSSGSSSVYQDPFQSPDFGEDRGGASTSGTPATWVSF